MNAAQNDDEVTNYIQDEIEFDLLPHEVDQRRAENGVRLDKKRTLEAEIEREKLVLKTLKGSLDELVDQMDECTKEIATERATRLKKWRVVTNYRTGAEVWSDPQNGRTVRTCAIPNERAQRPLFAVRPVDNVDFGAEDNAPDSQSPDLEDRLDRALSADDVDFGIDATQIIDAAPLDPVASEPPSKPSRRGRKAKA